MLYMSPAEITAKFKRNSDKRNQIDVLAQLNNCTKKEIIQALIDSGVKWEEIPKMRGINESMFKGVTKAESILPTDELSEEICREETNTEETEKSSAHIIKIPKNVIALCRDRSVTLSQRKAQLSDEIKSIDAELIELEYFLNETEGLSCEK